MHEDFNTIRELAGWATAGLLGTFLAFKRTLRMSASDDRQAEESRAGESLIKGLRIEVERLSTQNGRLADTLNELQLKLAELHSEVGHLRAENALAVEEIQDLRAENGRLKSEVSALHDEVERLRTVTNSAENLKT